jgi:hypothetical protein
VRSPKNFLIALFAFTTLATAILAWRQHLELVSLRAAASGPEQVATTPATWDALASIPAPASDEIATSASDSAPAPSSSAPATAVPARPGFARGDPLIENPEVQRLIMMQRKAGLDGRYAALFKALNLRPDQLDRFKELLVERMTVRNDVMGAVRSQGLSPRAERDAIATLVQQGEAEVDSTIRGLLGDAAYSQYQHYERTQPLRATVNQLEQRLSYTSTPLSPEQSAAILSILDRNGGTTADGPARFNALSDAALEQARGVLAAPQLEALRQLQEEQRAQTEMASAMRRQFESRRFETSATGGPTDAAPSRVIRRPPSGN